MNDNNLGCVGRRTAPRTVRKAAVEGMAKRLDPREHRVAVVLGLVCSASMLSFDNCADAHRRGVVG